MSLPVVIVGRPNVGKSTLFNRLAGRPLAIVDDSPGVTRDRREAAVQLGDLAFTAVDTAGFEGAAADTLAGRIQAQTERAVATAKVVLMLIDARAGISPLDHELADILRRAGLPVVLAANKYDGGAGEAGLLESYGLGLGEPVPLSAAHGEGLHLLLEALKDAAAGEIEQAAEAGVTAARGAEPGPKQIQLAIIGRPNVGKSSLVNALVGEERMITGPEAGITRDAVPIAWSYAGRAIRLIDTAGLRRQARVDDRLEALAAADTRRAIRFAHVCAIVIDGSVGLEKQDLTIARWVSEEGRAPLLVVNKADLIDDRRASAADLARRIQTSLAQLRGLKPAYVSALTGAGVGGLMARVLEAYESWGQHIGTGPLNRWLKEMSGKQAPPMVGGRPFKLRYIAQVSTRPPTFAVFANRVAPLPESYLRFLANGLRDRFGLGGVPLRFVVRQPRNPYAD
ncbi:GTPase Der [Candidatus Defluviicoccus seviourii]|uniref:GTPase Der n=1 Tax=Candidatus Defluviicoccus seviourii TaxID=2565273 RepID=A0A564WEK7_9PROT|nr:GTPase Der [Candidatus Defluviicoccus seviourii]